MLDGATTTAGPGGGWLDEEGRELHQHLTAIRAALAADRRAVVVAELRILAASLSSHFEQEQRWMEEERYPDRSVHARAHATGLEGLRQALAEYERAGAAAEFLVDRAAVWLERHVAGEDARFGRFLAQARGSAVPGNS